MRYFLIFFSAADGRSAVWGHESESYPSITYITDTFSKENNFESDLFGISNIIELTKEDYEAATS